jgi:hypothetical protein
MGVRIGIDVDEQTAEALAREAEALGFDSRGAYLQWLVDNRGDLEATADGGDASGAAADGGAVAPSGQVRLPDDGERVSAAATRLGSVERDRLGHVVRRSDARDWGPSDDDRPGAGLTDLDALELPGHDEELLERRRRAVGAALAVLAEAGEARRSDFLEALREEYPAGYGSDAGWWDCIKRGLRQVDRVRSADADSRVWRYRDFRGRIHVVSE